MKSSIANIKLSVPVSPLPYTTFNAIDDVLGTGAVVVEVCWQNGRHYSFTAVRGKPVREQLRAILARVATNTGGIWDDAAVDVAKATLAECEV